MKYRDSMVRSHHTAHDMHYVGYYTGHSLLKIGALAPTTPSPSPTPLSLGRRDSHYRTMGCCREKTSTFFTRFAPQTSLSTSSLISSLDRTLIRSIPLSQFSNSRTSLSFPSSLTSLQNSSVTTHGFAFKMNWGSTITIGSGCGFYGN